MSRPLSYLTSSPQIIPLEQGEQFSGKPNVRFGWKADISRLVALIVLGPFFQLNTCSIACPA